MYAPVRGRQKQLPVVIRGISRVPPKKHLKRQRLLPWLNTRKDWWNVKGEIRTLPSDYEPTDPFKRGWRSPLRDLPTGSDPRYIRIDPAHTYAIDGIGKSFLGGGIFLLAFAGRFGEGSIDLKLTRAYAKFANFCETHKKGTNVDDFSFKTFKITGLLFLTTASEQL